MQILTLFFIYFFKLSNQIFRPLSQFSYFKSIFTTLKFNKPLQKKTHQILNIKENHGLKQTISSKKVSNFLPAKYSLKYR